MQNSVNLDNFDMNHIGELAAQKEQEWKSISNLQIKSLQDALAVKELENCQLNDKFVKLKDDFKYNLRLLKERDLELAHFEEINQKLKIAEGGFLAEVSDLRINMESLREKLKQEHSGKTEMECFYKQRLLDQQTQMEIFRTSKNNEIEELIKDLRKVKGHSELKINQLESELVSQKVDLVHELEDVMRLHDRENHDITQELRTKCMNLEMRNKILLKEQEIVSHKSEEQTGVLKETHNENEKLRNRLQQAEWDIGDVSSLKNNRILELEKEVEHFKTISLKIEREYEERRKKLDQDMRSKQANLMAAKQSNLDREKHFENHILKLQTQLEQRDLEIKRALWDANDQKKNMEVQLAQKDREAESLQQKLAMTVSEQSKTNVAIDVEIITLKKREDLSKQEIKQLRDDIEKYKDELSKSLEREQSLQQSKVQMRIDWKRKLEENEANLYSKSENFSTNILKARDDQIAEANQLRARLDQLKRSFESVSLDRNLAMEVLQQHDLIAEFDRKLEHKDERGDNIVTPASQQLQELQNRNDQLRDIIRQMTSDMELLVDRQSSTVRDSEASDSVTTKGSNNAYIDSLEKDILDLKKENRKLKLNNQQENDVATDTPKVNSPSLVSLNHPTIQNHVNSLNKTIASLEAEKTNIRAQLLKTQANLDHQQLVAQQFQSENKASTNQIQQLEFQSTANKHKTDQELSRLKDQISTLTLKLNEARQEADEYYRGGIQNNMRAMELGGQLSQMTVGMATNTPWISNQVQAKVMQDLQNEITQLRKKLAHAKQHIAMTSGGRSPKESENVNIKVLENKLKQSQQKIISMTTEKRKLLESCNKMRAELMRKKKGEAENKMEKEEDNPVENDSPVKKPAGGSAKVGRLGQVEKLQYQLTRQELAFAQRRPLSKLSQIQQHGSSTEYSNNGADQSLEETPVTSTPQPIHHVTSNMTSSMDSMSKVWRILDQAPSSPSIASEIHEEGAAAVPRHPTMTSPQKPVAPHAKQIVVLPKTRKINAPRPKPKPKIRNYNLKDDSVHNVASLKPGHLRKHF